MKGITRNELSNLLKVTLLTVINWESSNKIKKIESIEKTVFYDFDSVKTHINDLKKYHQGKSNNFSIGLDSLNFLENKQIESEKLFKENLEKYNKSIK